MTGVCCIQAYDMVNSVPMNWINNDMQVMQHIRMRLVCSANVPQEVTNLPGARGMLAPLRYLYKITEYTFWYVIQQGAYVHKMGPLYVLSWRKVSLKLTLRQASQVTPI